MINWHRLFGLALMDYFTGTVYDVEVEKDLSIKQQFLDVLIIEKTGAQGTREIQEPCDGLENMRRFNLMTFKSFQETLDVWAIEELLGHYVNFRKWIGLKVVNPDEIQLYAVCMRYPRELGKKLWLRPIEEGVYDLEALSHWVRVIVLNKIPMAQRNALWTLFSNNKEKVTYGAHHYEWHRSNWSLILSHLYHQYQHGEPKMAYTMEDFEKDCEKSLPIIVPKIFPAEKMMPHYSLEDRLRGLDAEDRLRGLSAEDLLQGLSAGELEKLKAKLMVDKVDKI